MNKTVQDMKAEIESIKRTKKQKYGSEIVWTQSGTSEASQQNASSKSQNHRHWRQNKING